MRWSIAAALLLTLAACDPPPPAPAPTTSARPSPGKKDALAGRYRLTKSSRKTVAKWGKRFKKDKALRYLERLDVQRTAAGDLSISSPESGKGPYVLRSAGPKMWTYPLKKGWKVHVKHQRGRDRIRAWVGPVSVIYVRDR